jgi:hypothetical protein
MSRTLVAMGMPGGPASLYRRDASEPANEQETIQ